MEKLNFQAKSADKSPMRTLFSFVLVCSLVAPPAFARATESKPASCVQQDSTQTQLNEAQSNLDKANAGAAGEFTDEVKNTLKSRVQTLTFDLDTYKSRCSTEADGRADKKKDCDAKIAQGKNLWKWNPNAGSYGECEDAREEVKANPNEGECSNAELMKGTNLKGEACKKTAGTIKDVQAQQDSLTSATTAATSAYATSVASNTSGFQSSAMASQQKILKTLAMSKMATAAVNIMGAGQLKLAAGNASEAASNISGAEKQLSDFCNGKAAELSNEQCFYANAKSYGVPSDSASYANFERMQSAATQSQDQADKANSMAGASLMTGAADAVVAYQAWKMANQTQDQAVNMGAVPLPPGYALNGASQGGLSPNGVAPGTGAGNGVTDFGAGNGIGGGLGEGGGPAGNSIQDGKGFAPSTFQSAKSTVSTAGGGGAGGGGGGSGASKSGGKKGGMLGDTGKSEYNLGGGAAGFKGGNAPTDKPDNANAFADALAKLFPQDPNGKPVVDSRQPASTTPITEDAFAGSDVSAVDLTLFEQITSKYRKLTGEGSI